MKSGLIQPFDSMLADYLHDESRMDGCADSIAFPTSEDEVRDVVKAVAANGGSITIQGARTGIAGGAVPRGGCVLNLSRLIRMDLSHVEAGFLEAQPGVTLDAVRTALSDRNAFFPPDPTETTASIGGMVATNASGAMSFHYGPTRQWIEQLRMVLADGSLLVLQRGANKANGRRFTLTTGDGRTLRGVLPPYTIPSVKSAAGYYAADDMDLIDLFIGMEGTLGIVTGVQLRLIPPPPSVCGLTVFMPSRESALTLVRLARGETVGGRTGLSSQPVALEYFNHDTLMLLRRMKAEGRGAEAVPALKPHYHTAVYLEWHGRDDETTEAAALAAIEIATALGGSDEDTWYAASAHDLGAQKAFRHAVPEAVNALIGERRKSDPAITKLGTDMSVPDASLESVMTMYQEDLAAAGLESVIFGHIGNNHVHVNILPRSREEYERGRALYQSWARRVVDMGGSVSAEHGIGRLKTSLLAMMFGDAGISGMRDLKRLLDPSNILNPGVLFPCF